MAKVDVIMPQMGESIAEGTLTKWLKEVGAEVERDEDLFEISTDKVDADIPSPVSGILAEILVEEGDTVEVNTIVARIETEAGAAVAEPPEAEAEPHEGPAEGHHAGQQQRSGQGGEDQQDQQQIAVHAVGQPANRQLEQQGARPMLALNKVDGARHETMLAIAAAVNERLEVQETFMVSALTGDGVDDLRQAVLDRLPEGPWLYPEDQISDLPSRMLAAEATREKLFLQLHQELPYNLTVETEAFEVQAKGDLKINQVIYVTRDSHKAMVLGKGGSRIRQVGSESRRDLEVLFDRKVHLFLFVKVRENWLNDPERFREMGLEL